MLFTSLGYFVLLNVFRFRLTTATIEATINAAIEAHVNIFDDCTGSKFGNKSFDVDANIIFIPSPAYVDFSPTTSTAFYIYVQIRYGPQIREYFRKTTHTVQSFYESLSCRLDKVPACVQNMPIFDFANQLWFPCTQAISNHEQCREIYAAILSNDTNSSNVMIAGGIQLNTAFTYIALETVLVSCKDNLTVVSLVFQFDNYTIACMNINLTQNSLPKMSDRELVERNNEKMFSTTAYRNDTKMKLDCMNNGTALPGGGCECSTATSGPFCFFPCPNTTVSQCRTGIARWPIMNDQCYYEKCAPYRYASQNTDSLINDVYVEELNVTFQPAYDKYPPHLQLQFRLKNVMCHFPDYHPFVKDRDHYLPTIPDGTEFLDVTYLNNVFCYEMQTVRYALTHFHAYRNYQLVLKQRYANSLHVWLNQPFVEVNVTIDEAPAGSIEKLTIEKNELGELWLTITTEIIQCNGRIKNYEVTVLDTATPIHQLTIPVDQDCRKDPDIVVPLPKEWLTFGKDVSLTVSAFTESGKGQSSRTILPTHSINQPNKNTIFKIVLISLGAFLAVVFIGLAIIGRAWIIRRQKLKTLTKFLDQEFSRPNKLK